MTIYVELTLGYIKNLMQNNEDLNGLFLTQIKTLSTVLSCKIIQLFIIT